MIVDISCKRSPTYVGTFDLNSKDDIDAALKIEFRKIED